MFSPTPSFQLSFEGYCILYTLFLAWARCWAFRYISCGLFFFVVVDSTLAPDSNVVMRNLDHPQACFVSLCVSLIYHVLTDTLRKKLLVHDKRSSGRFQFRPSRGEPKVLVRHTAISVRLRVFGLLNCRPHFLEPNRERKKTTRKEKGKEKKKQSLGPRRRRRRVSEGYMSIKAKPVGCRERRNGETSE